MSFAMYSDNLINQSTLTCADENSLFPLANIKDDRRSKVFRSTTNTTSIVVDFNETSLIDTVFIVPDKRNGFGVSTIVLEFNATDSWASPAQTETITISTEHNLAFKTFASVYSYRYCRIVLTSTLPYCEISNVFLGTALTISKSINFGWTYKDAEISSQRSNRYGQLFTDIVARQKNIACSISYLNKEDLDELFKAYDICGESKPLFIRIGCAEMINDFRRFSGMFYIKDIPSISNTYFNKYNISFTFVEAM